MLNLRRSLRSFASRPFFPAVVITTLALGLGVNAAIFSLTREVLLRPLPYRDADRLVRVFEVSRALGVASAPIAPVNYVGWRDHVDAFEQTAVFRRVAFNVSLKTGAVQVEGFQIAPAFLPMLGVELAVGRGFTAEDAQRFWNTTDVVGKRLRPVFPKSLLDSTQQWRNAYGCRGRRRRA